MTTAMPVLETERLTIRPFVLDDLADAHRILDLEAKMGEYTLEGRRQWLEWTVRNYAELAKMYQPPLGDRAIVLRAENRLIGAVGLVPALGPFGLLPSFQNGGKETNRFTSELGMFWALGNADLGKGYATEAARALVDYAFDTMNMARIVATTEHENKASQAVMRRLGMRIETNPQPEPPWFQVVGSLVRE